MAAKYQRMILFLPPPGYFLILSIFLPFIIPGFGVHSCWIPPIYEILQKGHDLENGSYLIRAKDSEGWKCQH